MPSDVLLPQWGMGMNDGQVTRWLRQEGDEVKKGDALVEIESSKVNSEVEATADGTLGRVLVQEGTIVPVGTRLAVILLPGEDAAVLPPVGQTDPAAQAAPVAPPDTSVASPGTPQAAPGGQRRVVTPRARRLAREMGVDPESIDGTGPSGRGTEADVRRAAEGGTPAQTPAASPSTVPVTETIRLTGLRGTIARRMAESAKAPTVTLNTHADVTAAIEMQRRLTGDWRQHRIRPQYQDLVLAAVARALREHPKANAHLVGDEVRVLGRINLGVTMAIPEGLLVPVIRDAAEKSALELAQEVRGLASKAKANSLSVDDMTGGTFTITNLGAYDIEAFNPLINPPEIGILGVGRVEERPAVVDGEMVIRSIGHLSLTFDHRAWDGAPASEFLRTIVKHLREPGWMAA